MTKSNELASACSLREWYAGLALAGLLAGDHTDSLTVLKATDLAFVFADAMIDHSIEAKEGM